MTDRLAEQFAQLEGDRSAIFARIDGLTAEQLCRRPGDGEWSVSQVLGHLILAEELSLGYIRKKMKAPEQLRSPGLVDKMKSRLLTVMLRSPLRFKSPKAAADPPEESDLSQIRAHWDSVRGSWRGLIAEMPPELADRAIYRHPVVGPMSLTRCLTFLAEHITHHRHQIDRILAAIDA